MDRETSLITSFLIFIVFVIISYYGSRVTLWSSINFSIFVSLIILNVFYPINKLTTDECNSSLIVYIVLVIISIVLLGIYITQKSLCDFREE